MSNPSDPSPPLHIKLLKLRRERIGEADVLVTFCPRRLAVMGVAECRKCDLCEGLCIDASDNETQLRCAWEAPKDAAPGDDAAAAAAASTPGRMTSISDIMTTSVRCVTKRMGVHALTTLFLDAAISATPVLNDEGRLIGIVSKTDVLRHCYDNDGTFRVSRAPAAMDIDPALELGPGFHTERFDEATVEDVMSRLVFCLDESASISRAAALMAYEGVHRVVITGASGEVCGILSSLDVLRWLARTDGYVIPNRTRVQMT